jgi:hypothetical protein
MDTGTGLAVFGGLITLAATIIKFAPSRSTNGYVRKETCEARHHGMAREVREMKEEMVRVWTALDGLKEVLLKGRAP